MAFPQATTTKVGTRILTTGGSGTDASSYSSSAILPTGNRLILAWVYSIAAGTPNTPTASGNGLTWVEVANQLDDDGVRKLTLFRAMGSSPTSGVTTFDFGGGTQTGCAWSIVEYESVNTGGTNGSSAIVQAVASKSTGTATSLTVTLASFGSADNATAGGFGIPLNTTNLPAEGTGFTDTGQLNQSGPNLAIGSEFRSDNDTSVDMTSAAASIPWTGIAVEIAFVSKLSTVATEFSTSVTSMPVEMPVVVDSGDLLIAAAEVRNSGTWTVPTGWTEFDSQVGGSSVGELTLFYMIADGTEGATTETWTASTGTSAIWQVTNITDWHGTTPPESTTSSGDSTTNPNPPNLTPSWGSDDTLWLEIAGNAATANLTTGASTGYSNYKEDTTSSGGGQANMSSAYKENAAASEDPDEMANAGSIRYWAATTIGIRPVVVAVTTKSVADTGSGADATTILNIFGVTDSGSGVDAPSILSLLPQTDSGSGSDVPTILNIFSVADTGSGADEETIIAEIPVADTLGLTLLVDETMVDPPTDGSIGGDASHDDVNDYIQLTPVATSQNGYYYFEQALKSKIIVQFDWWAGGGSGADSVSFYLNATTHSGNEEDGYGRYVIYFSEYNHITGIRYNGSLLASAAESPLNFDDSTWKTARMEINLDDDTFKIFIDNVLVLDFTDSTHRTFTDDKWGWGARTGGADNEHRIRNVKLWHGDQLVDSEITLVNTISIADTSSGSEALAILALLAITDTGAGIDALSFLAEIPITDAGSGSELIAVVSLLIEVLISDSGSGSDAQTIIAEVPVADSGAGSDAESILALVSETDSGSGLDAVEAAVFVDVADSAAGVDSLTILAEILITDVGAGNDTVALLIFVPVTDTGVGVDSETIIAEIPISESGFGSGAIAVLALVDVPDSGSGVDTESILAEINLSDSSSASDLISILAEQAIADSGSGVDATSITGLIDLSDSGSGVDLQSILNLIPILETSASVDIQSILKITQLSDTATRTFLRLSNKTTKLKIGKHSTKLKLSGDSTKLTLDNLGQTVLNIKK